MRTERVAALILIPLVHAQPSCFQQLLAADSDASFSLTRAEFDSFIEDLSFGTVPLTARGPYYGDISSLEEVFSSRSAAMEHISINGLAATATDAEKEEVQDLCDATFDGLFDYFEIDIVYQRCLDILLQNDATDPGRLDRTEYLGFSTDLGIDTTILNLPVNYTGTFDELSEPVQQPFLDFVDDALGVTSNSLNTPRRITNFCERTALGVAIENFDLLTATLSPSRAPGFPGSPTVDTGSDSPAPTTSDLAVTNLPTGAVTDVPTVPSTTTPGVTTPEPTLTATQFNQCRLRLGISDQGANDILTEGEYTTFLNLMSQNLFNGFSFDDLSPSFQAIYSDNARTDGFVSLENVRPGGQIDATQEARYRDICGRSIQLVEDFRNTPTASPQLVPTPPPMDPPTRSPSSPTSTITATQFNQCRLRLGIASGSDYLMSQSEYVNFLNFMSQNLFSGVSFSGLGSSLQAIYNENTNSDGIVSMVGVRPGGQLDAAQEARYRDVCERTVNLIESFRDAPTMSPMPTPVALTVPPVSTPTPSLVSSPTGGNVPTYGYQQCFFSMAIADSSPRDNYLGEVDFVRFLNRMESNKFSGSAFGALPELVQMTYSGLRASSLGIDIALARPGVKRTPEQTVFLENVCDQVAEAVFLSENSTTSTTVPTPSGGSSPTSTTAVPPFQAPTTSTPFSPPSENSTPTMAPISNCGLQMVISDNNPRDGFMNEEEYVAFLNRVQSNAFAGLEFGSLAAVLQDHFEASAIGRRISLAGARPGQGSASDQAVIYEFCASAPAAIQVALFGTSVPMDISSDAPSSSPSLASPTSGGGSPLPSSGQLTVFNAFILSNTAGLAAFPLISGTNGDAINVGYKNFINETVTQYIAAVNSSRRSRNLRGRRLVITALSSFTTSVYEILDTTCPPGAPGGSACQIAYGSFDVNYARETDQSLIATLTSLTTTTQDAILGGAKGLELFIAEQSPTISIRVEGIAADLQPTYDDGMPSPTGAPAPKEGGDDVGFNFGLLVGIVVVILVLCLTGAWVCIRRNRGEAIAPKVSNPLRLFGRNNRTNRNDDQETHDDFLDDFVASEEDVSDYSGSDSADDDDDFAPWSHPRNKDFSDDEKSNDFRDYDESSGFDDVWEEENQHSERHAESWGASNEDSNSLPGSKSSSYPTDKENESIFSSEENSRGYRSHGDDDGSVVSGSRLPGSRFSDQDLSGSESGEPFADNNSQDASYVSYEKESRDSAARDMRGFLSPSNDQSFGSQSDKDSGSGSRQTEDGASLVEHTLDMMLHELSALLPFLESKQFTDAATAVRERLEIEFGFVALPEEITGEWQWAEYDDDEHMNIAERQELSEMQQSADIMRFLQISGYEDAADCMRTVLLEKYGAIPDPEDAIGEWEWEWVELKGSIGPTSAHGSGSLVGNNEDGSGSFHHHDTCDFLIETHDNNGDVSGSFDDADHDANNDEEASRGSRSVDENSHSRQSMEKIDSDNNVFASTLQHQLSALIPFLEKNKYKKAAESLRMRVEADYGCVPTENELKGEWEWSEFGYEDDPTMSDEDREKLLAQHQASAILRFLIRNGCNETTMLLTQKIVKKFGRIAPGRDAIGEWEWAELDGSVGEIAAAEARFIGDGSRSRQNKDDSDFLASARNESVGEDVFSLVQHQMSALIPYLEMNKFKKAAKSLRSRVENDYGIVIPYNQVKGEWMWNEFDGVEDQTLSDEDRETRAKQHQASGILRLLIRHSYNETAGLLTEKIIKKFDRIAPKRDAIGEWEWTMYESEDC